MHVSSFSLCDNLVASQTFSQISVPEFGNISPEALITFKYRLTLADMRNMEEVYLIYVEGDSIGQIINTFTL